MTSQDWKKQAAAVVDDNQIEKAFLDQAYTHIAHKARAIMQPPYRLGFEVVYKNDDNTRMVGIFAFRISKDLYYAPVFFLNGDIKGTDLLYRHTTKTFVPLTAEWIQHLLDSDVSQMGRPVTRQFSMNIPQYMNLHRLVRPDYGTGMKSASAAVSPDDVFDHPSNNARLTYKQILAQLPVDKGVSAATVSPELRALLETNPEGVHLNNSAPVSTAKVAAEIYWDEFFKSASEKKEVSPILGNFIQQDGGISALNLLAGAMEKSVKFANALYSLLPEDAYMPQITVQEKKAAFTKKASVILHREFGPSVKVASEDFHAKGYWFEDMRKEAAIVYEEPGEMQSVGEPGIYEIALKGGGLKKVFAARHTEERIGADISGYPGGMRATTIGGVVEPTVTWQLFCPETKEVIQDIIKPPVGFAERENEKVDGEYPFFQKEPTAGKGYVIFDTASGVMSEPFKVCEIETMDGLKKMKICQEYGYNSRSLTFNPDTKAVKLCKGVVGTDARFIEVKMELEGDSPRFPCDCVPGDRSDLDWYIYNVGMKSASVQKSGDEFRVREGRMQVTNSMDKLATICHLVRAFELRPEAAEELVEKAASAGSAAFRYEWPESVKQARAVMLLQEPQFDPSLDARFNTIVDPQPQYTIGTEYIPEPVPQQRIGDAWDPSMQSQFLATATPEQLAQTAESMQLPNVFEHGVVGQLVKTYDSAALIQKYIPKLEDALDCLGRLLFLLYWKPQDFKQLYGADDLASKESEILSSFRQFGDLVLSLVKQSKPQGTGNVVAN